MAGVLMAAEERMVNCGVAGAVVMGGFDALEKFNGDEVFWRTGGVEKFSVVKILTKPFVVCVKIAGSSGLPSTAGTGVTPLL